MEASNQLLRNYQTAQQNNILFKNNALLNSNPMFQNMATNNNLDKFQLMKIAQVQQQMDQIKQLQKIKQIEKANEIEKMFGKDKINECIMSSIHEKVDKGLDKDAYTKLTTLESAYPKIDKKKGKTDKEVSKFQKGSDVTQNLKELWKHRTNQPYKSVLAHVIDPKDPKVYNRTFKKKEDLLIHRTVTADKIGINEDLNKFKDQIETQNQELQVVYSTSKEAEHKKQFAYNHIHKFRLKYKPSDFNDMKKEKVNEIEEYKKTQMELEKDKNKADDMIESMLASGLLKDDEYKKAKNDNEIDIHKLENELKDRLGNEYDTLVQEAKEELLNENKKAESKQDKKSEKKPEKKLEIKPEINPEISSKVIKTGKIDDSIREKYKSKQKKTAVQVI